MVKSNIYQAHPGSICEQLYIQEQAEVIDLILRQFKGKSANKICGNR
jgi:hypothetical protein